MYKNEHFSIGWLNRNDGNNSLNMRVATLEGILGGFNNGKARMGKYFIRFEDKCS